jgi:CHAT domain-containing protein/tetratricopeptide (TPR) repeat protein
MSNRSICVRRVVVSAVAALWILQLVAPISSVAQTAPAIASELLNLELNRTFERGISGGQKNTYSVELSAGEFASIMLEQKGIDVFIRFIDKDGAPIAEFDSETRPNGVELIEAVSIAAGTYKLEVEPRLKSAAAGQYTIRWTERRSATQNDRSLQTARTLADKSRALDRSGKYKEALEFAQQVLSIRESILGSDHLEVGAIVNRIGNLTYSLGDNAKAEVLYERALKIYTDKLGPEHLLVSQVLNNLAVLHRVRGDLIEAEQLFLRSLDIKEKLFGPNDPTLTASLNNLGIVYRRLGDDFRAEASYQRSLSIRERTLGPDHSDVASVLMNIAALRFYEGDFASALELDKRALAIREKNEGPDHPIVALTLDNVASSYMSAGEFDLAKPLILRAIDIQERRFGVDHPSVSRYLDTLARYYFETGDQVSARPILERAIRVGENDKSRDEGDYSNLVFQLGTLDMAQGRYEDAKNALMRALTIREKTSGVEHQSIGRVCSALGKLYLLTGNLEQSLKYQTCSAQINDRNIALNLAVGSEHQKLAYLAQLSDDLEQTIAMSVDIGHQSVDARRLAAAEVLQRKGRVLDATAATLSTLRRSLNAEDRLLFDKLSKVNGSLADLTLNRPSDLPDDDYDKLLSDLRSKRDSLERDISIRTRGSYSGGSGVKLEDVQKLIPTDAALIEYAVYRPVLKTGKNGQGDPRYAAFVISNTGVTGAIDLGSAVEIDRAAGSLRAALRDPKRSDYVQLSRALELKLVGPIRSLIQNKTHLIISPESELNLIPFEALYDQKKQPLIANHLITYVTSGRDLARMAIKRESKAGPAIVADPMFEDAAAVTKTEAGGSTSSKSTLSRRRSATSTRDISETYFAPLSATAREAQSIQALFPDSKVLTGARATETAVKELSAPKFLHIATHGFFLQGQERSTVSASKAGKRIENPLLRSGLALAGANRHVGGSDDGMFTALEASGLDLWGTKLVVLSACDTGLGDIRTGEGVYGLRRAIAIAGAESMVMSLWPVSDFVTRELMTNYYANLKKGLGRGEALRQVQIQMIKNRKHPFYWASFIQAGEWADLNGNR